MQIQPKNQYDQVQLQQIQQQTNKPHNPTNPIQHQQHQIQHKTLNHNSLYYTFMQRYFTTYENQHQRLHLHSNGICLISFKPQSLISKIIKITQFIQILQVKGKKKKGGVKVRPDTVIAKIVCQNQQKVNVYALIEGTILEKNQKLNIQNIAKPQGYFIVILPVRKVIPQKIGMKRIIIDHLGQ